MMWYTNYVFMYRLRYPTVYLGEEVTMIILTVLVTTVIAIQLRVGRF